MYDLDLEVVDRRDPNDVGGVEALPLTIEDVAGLVAHTLIVVDVPEGVIEGGVSFVSTATIAELNFEHRGVAGPTDVLSFPIDELDELGEGIPRQLGDVMICAAYVAGQVADGSTMVTDDGDAVGDHDEHADAGVAAPTGGAQLRSGDTDLRGALARCVVHGTLHVLGFDHEGGAADQARMFELEEQALGEWRDNVHDVWSDEE